jgi:hypothetical protein
MMAGPTMRDALTSAPVSITTRPMSSHPGCTVPRCSGSTVSSTSRLTSSMSATLPVSFQYPEIVVDATFRPSLISPWMASVISSSPRRDGGRLRTASCTQGVNM